MCFGHVLVQDALMSVVMVTPQDVISGLSHQLISTVRDIWGGYFSQDPPNHTWRTPSNRIRADMHNTTRCKNFFQTVTTQNQPSKLWKHRLNFGSILGQRLRRCPRIDPAFGDCLSLCHIRQVSTCFKRHVLMHCQSRWSNPPRGSIWTACVSRGVTDVNY